MDNDKVNWPWMAVGALILCCCGLSWLLWKSEHRQREVSADVTIDTVVKRDTIRYDHPVCSQSMVVRNDTAYVALAKHGHPTEGPDSLPSEGGSDSARVVIPIERKTYKDSDYLAVVSGYNVSLDSLLVFPKTYYITKTQTVTKRPRFSLGIIGGAGYGVFSRKTDVFVGVGGSFRLWP